MRILKKKEAGMPDLLEDKLRKLTHLIYQSKICVALTGAGVSTLSGIPDFRSESGLWQKFDANKIFDYSLYSRQPQYFWNFAFEFIYDFFNKQPNIIHQTLACLEQKGKLKAVITQNIDLLHQKAGNKKVIELHGSPERHYCMQCLKEYSLDWIMEKVKKREIPYCESCRGIIKPDITFFGEMLPEGALEKAMEWAKKADLMLLLGSSMVVYPANLIPAEFLRSGGELIIVNRQSTQYDKMATMRFDDLELVFRYLWNYCREKI
jgi:NAD-dependent deacetylase